MPLIESSAVTDAGRVRTVNEDAVVASYPVYVVADGMGGHEAGEVASALAVEELSRLADLPGPVREADVKQAVSAAHTRVARLAAEWLRRKAGTTLTGAVVVERDHEPWWMVLNLGDSRTYRLADGRLTQLSTDHSEVQEMVQAGQITQAEARTHPRRNVVTKALGAGVVCEPDYWLAPLRTDDRLLVCSDGLTSEVTDARIAHLLFANPDPASAAQALAAEAWRMGGNDNISVIVANEVRAAR
jgi:protein phosphatase